MSDITCDDAPAVPAGGTRTREARAAWPAVWSLSLGVFGLMCATSTPPALLTSM